MSKYKLKNEYKNILKEFRVNVENDNFYFKSNKEMNILFSDLQDAHKHLNDFIQKFKSQRSKI